MKTFALKHMRRRAMQPLWDKLGHVSILGRNYWATSVAHSGELVVMKRLASRLGHGSVVVDVGANIGNYSLEAVRLLNPKRVHAFEPAAHAFARLTHAIEAGGLEDRIIAHRLALGSQPGTATLHTPEPGSTIASLIDVRNPLAPFAAKHDEQVEVTTLDAFCRSTDIARIGLLKVDVEGLEYAVLEGAKGLIRDRAIDAIQFEFGEGHIDARTFVRDFFDLLGDDYLMHRIVSDGLHPVPRYSAELEVFAPINFLALLKSPPAR
jgi:FkbM family methyltransferase